MTSDSGFDRLARNFRYLCASLHNGPRGAAPAKGWQAGGRAAAVVCWDLSHNPAGRAHVLYKLLSPDWNVELIGPIWPRFGTTLWEPLRNEGLNWHPLYVHDLADVWREAAAVAMTRRFDVVIISKPRLPGLIAGLLLAEQSRCPVVLDFDEDEHAFVQHEQDNPATSAARLLHEPFGRAGTALAAQYWNVADALTVSSPVLGRRLGGHVVRHARDESLNLASRAEARRRLGYGEADLVLAFVGTARPHKGLEQVLAALDAVADPRLKLMVVGAVPDAALLHMLGERADVKVLGGCDMGALSTFLAAADLVPLLQDENAPITQTQIPAKLSDALQHGIKVVATPTPPLQDLAANGIIDVIPSTGLASYLRNCLLSDIPQPGRAQIRRFFENEFSLRVNRVRLDAAIAEAQLVSTPFARTIPETLQGLSAAMRRARDACMGSARQAGRTAIVRSEAQYDVAFFWKQNDSDLFGRRSDMVTRHLLESGRVRRIVHFDRPINPTALRCMASAKLAGARNARAMEFAPTVSRALRIADEPGLARRVFLTQDDGGAPTFGGRPLANLAALPEFVAASLREAHLDPERTLAWVCPTVSNFAAIAEHVKFHRIIVDLIDDERGWAKTAEKRMLVEQEYAQTLELADLVLTNGIGNHKRFASLRDDIHVIPNGAEFGEPPAGAPAPAFLAQLRHPTIGYIGNLTDRIDWTLVRGVAERRPDWDFVLIGPYEETSVPPEVAVLPNVLLPGPVPYDVGRRCLRFFDCAILPHTRDDVTAAMNPLKVYNYLAAGLPVVATPVANLEGVQTALNLADSPDDFIAAIEAALSSPRTNPADAGLDQELSWQSRVSAMLDLVDQIETGQMHPRSLYIPRA